VGNHAALFLLTARMALSSDELQEIVDTAAAGPLKASTGAGSVEARPLKELMELQQGAAADEAAADGPLFGLRVRKARFGRRSGGDC